MIRRPHVTYHMIPGTRFATEHRRELPALTLAVARFMGVEAFRARTLATSPDRFTADASRWSRAVIDWLDVDLDVHGVDAIDWARPHVVVALHEGMLDPILLLATLPAPLRFVARAEIADWPVIGSTLRTSGQILLDPEDPLAAARTLLREGSEAVAAGFSPVVFAQGTVLGIEAAFESGAFGLARAADVEIVPVVIAGTHRIYEWPFSPVVRRGQVATVRVLAPRHGPDPFELEAEMRAVALENQHAPVRHFDPDRDGWWDGYRFSISEDYPELAARVAQRRAQRSSRRAMR